MNKQRYLIKTGPHAGKTFDGVGCFSRATPDSEPDSTKYGEGIWVAEIGERFPSVRDQWSKEWGHTEHYQNLVVAFDKYGNEIFVGDTLYAAVKNEVRAVKVTKIKDLFHAGYGSLSRKILVTDIDSGQTLTINHPVATVKIIGA